MTEGNERYRAHKAKKTGDKDEDVPLSEPNRQGVKRRDCEDQAEEKPEHGHVGKYQRQDDEEVMENLADETECRHVSC